jgi:hypothetical protein
MQDTATDRTTTAKVAASRAEALRQQAASLNTEALAPLRKALLIRAAELDLAADVLDEPELELRVDTASPERHLQAIA